MIYQATKLVEENKEKLSEESIESLETEKAIAIEFLAEQAEKSTEEFDEARCDEVIAALQGKLMYVGAELHKPSDEPETSEASEESEQSEEAIYEENDDDVIEAEIVE